MWVWKRSVIDLKKSLRNIALDKESCTEKADRADAAEIINRYSGFSEDMLIKELLNETGRQKAEGSFDADALEQGVNAIAPMLNEEQRRRLYDIVGMLS